MHRASIQLRQALGPVSFVGCADIRAKKICRDSRRVQPGDVFAAVRGAEVDGHVFIDDAIANGASAVILEHPRAGITVPQCVVPDSQAAWAAACMATYGNPEAALRSVGITGTNGKTTTCWLLRSILQAHGLRCGMLGTIEYSDGVTKDVAPLTTPDAMTIAMMMDRMVGQQATCCVMEVSSHALDQGRCLAVPFAAAAITNLTQDHFDYHPTPEHYRDSKLRIAAQLSENSPLFVCSDDEGCRQLISLLPPSIRVLRFGMTPDADVIACVRSISDGVQHVEFTLLSGTVDVQLSLTGRHNVLNCLVAAAIADSLGIPAESIAKGIQRLMAVPGRMERIHEGQPFQVFVDFAHTPDGLKHCLQTARESTSGRVICVFGAGGNRDRQKRPLMAQAVEAGAEIAVLTSDNPRSEDPQQILTDVAEGFQGGIPIYREPDRFVAIQRALELAQPNDTIVIAGRGHESVQVVGDREISFDDRKVVRSLLKKMNQP